MQKTIYRFILFFIVMYLPCMSIIAQTEPRPYTLDDYPNILLYSSLKTDQWKGWTESPYSGSEFWGLISPELDLSGTSRPMLISHGAYVYTSTDGKTFTEHSLNDEKLILSKDVKYIGLGSEVSDGAYAYVIDMLLDETPYIGKPEIQLVKGEDSESNYYLYGFGELQEDGSYAGVFECVLKSGRLAELSEGLAKIEFDKNTHVHSVTFTFTVGNERILVNGPIDNGGYGSSTVLIPPGTSEMRISAEAECEYGTCEVKSLQIHKISYTHQVNEHSTNKLLHYDVDGDGFMEWTTNSYDGWPLYKLDKNLASSQVISPSLVNNDYTQAFAWANIDNAGTIDFYNPNLGGSVYKMDGTKATKVFPGEVGTALNPMDYDNDGAPDFLMRSTSVSIVRRGRTLTRDMNGNWVTSSTKIITPEEYANVDKELQLGSGGYTSPPGMGDMIGHDGLGYDPEATYGTLRPLDMNSDGNTDFVDGEYCTIYMNTGNGSYVEQFNGNKMYFRDFNNDGLVDYVTYDEENKTVFCALSQRDGTRKDVKLVTGLYCNRLFCCDYDKDGDVDIVVPVDFSSNDASFLVLMENRGDGSFAKHEEYIDGRVFFFDCLDIDADGCYEVVAAMSYNEGNLYHNKQHEILAYRIEGQKVNEAPIHITTDDFFDVPVSGNAPLLLADFDCSGNVKMSVGQKIYEINNAVNAVPEAPGEPSCTYDEHAQLLRISWPEAKDKESSTADLTYALRIGTAPGLGDMLYAHATEDGRRLNFDDGNNGWSRQRTMSVKTWPAGKYYISVQAVDPNHRGSCFSDCAVFEKTTPDVSFVLVNKPVCTVLDTCTVVLGNVPDADYTYTWEWDGGRIIDTDERGTFFHVMFDALGKKTVRLRVNDAQGNLVGSAEHTLEIVGANVVNIPNGKSYNEAVDLDEDGVQELIEDKVYEYAEDGGYTPVKYLYNNDFDGKRGVVAVDYCNDGHADLWMMDDGVMWHNDGGKQMSKIEEYQFLISGVSFNLMGDVDNDGTIDIFDNGHLWMNYGNCGNFEYVEKPYKEGIYGSYMMADYDKDGLLDIIVGNSSDRGGNHLLTNNGDNTFSESNPEAFAMLNAEEGFSIGENTTMADIDGDGKWDFARTKAAYGWGIYSFDKEITVVWGDGSRTIVPCEDERPFHEIDKMFDYDNNGCQDIFLMCHDSRSGKDFPTVPCIVFFYPDHSYDLQFVEARGNGMEYVSGDGSMVTGYNKVKCKPNAVPEAPTNLRASQNRKSVVIEWNHARDAETPEKLMRYNVSIKNKGIPYGCEAYFYSPLNATKDHVLPPASARLFESNKMTIPLTTIPAGEYIVQIQGIDRQRAASAFSAEYHLTVLESSVVDMPTSAVVDKDVSVSIIGNATQEVSFGDGADARKQPDGTYKVRWSTTGKKTVSVGTAGSADIFVYPRTEGAFTLPERTMLGATVYVQAQNVQGSEWTVSMDGGEPLPIGQSGDVAFSVVDSDVVRFVFNKEGEYAIRHIVGEGVTTEEYGSSTVVGRPAEEIRIDHVDLCPETGKFRIHWDAACVPENALHACIYKETSRFNEFEMIGRAVPETCLFTDMESVPEVVSARYKISFVLRDGTVGGHMAETAASTAHQPAHVMINKGLGNTVNLHWTHYEGRAVESYVILGGATPDGMGVVSTVSGNISSYSDLNLGNGLKYYAVETVFPTAAEARDSRRASARRVSRSNIVCVDDAMPAKMVEDIWIISETGSFNMPRQANEASLQLMAYIYPAYSELRTVDWVLVDGHDYAEISQSGLFKVRKSGQYTVRACAKDGSGVYREVTITARVTTGIDNADSSGAEMSLEATFADDKLTILGIPDNGHDTFIHIYSTNGAMLKTVRTRQPEAVIDCSGLPKGVYVCKVSSRKGKASIRFVKGK